MIDKKSGGSNFGTLSTLTVNSENGNKDKRSLVTFTLPTVPAGCKISSAYLRLYATSVTSGRTLQALQVASGWTETGVTWNTQPSVTGTAAIVNITSTTPGYLQWDVTSSVQAIYSNTNYGFLIRDANEGASGTEQFNSRESSSNQPQLVINYTQGP